MKRIYFDSNVFRHIKQKPNLLEQAFDSINCFIFYYSYAHLADLSRDKTDKKFEDLVFMESLVDHNFLNLKPGHKFINIQMLSPNDAFQNLITQTEKISFSNILDDIFPHENSTPEIEKAKELLKMFLTFPMDKISHFDNLQLSEKESPIEKFIPNTSDSLLQYLEKLVNTFDNLNTDVKEWRGLRNYTIENLNFKNFDIDIQNVDFNESLKNTKLQQTFIEFVETAMNQFSNTDNREQYNFFIAAYTCLNLLGIDKEKNQKVVFSSFQNDAQHAYYAAHCQYLISDDEQLLLKARALYNLFGIETKVLSTSEFFDNLDSIASVGELEFEELMQILKDTKININFEESEMFEGVKIFHLHEPIFDYFNRMQIVDSDSPILIFYNDYNNYSMFTSFEEMELITNRIVRTLGRDLYNLKNFSSTDAIEIQNESWRGRIWDFEFSRFYLEINNRRFSLHYEPKFE